MTKHYLLAAVGLMILLSQLPTALPSPLLVLAGAGLVLYGGIGVADAREA